VEPIERSDHDSTYKGEHEGEDGEIVNEGVGDLTYKRGDRDQVLTHWIPTIDEIGILQQGGHVEVGIYAEPIPPIHVVAVPQPEE
jgi:hypothetical protein